MGAYSVTQLSVQYCVLSVQVSYILLLTLVVSASLSSQYTLIFTLTHDYYLRTVYLTPQELFSSSFEVKEAKCADFCPHIKYCGNADPPG